MVRNRAKKPRETQKMEIKIANWKNKVGKLQKNYKNASKKG